MKGLHVGTTPYPVTREVRWRHRFSLLAVLVTVVLMAWGGFVTTIEAGMAVPDWPSSFGSYDPFETGYQDPNNPGAQWWDSLPVLAEHGHRLLGALAGLVTLALAVWTWLADRRSWMRNLGFFALFLVIVQGILGGLRVVFNSLDLAVVHACAAQLFFATLVAMALFTSRGWLRADSLTDKSPALDRLRLLSTITVAALFGQIILGALLRHRGAGVAPGFVITHITGALVVAGLAIAVFFHVYKHLWDKRLLRKGALCMMGSLILQILLGFSAYAVILMESRLGQLSMLQITLNSVHLIVGALLMASAVSMTLLSLRQKSAEPAPRSAAVASL